MWTSTFGWKNLLWELDPDKTDSHRRVDKAHPQLPVGWLKESLEKNLFADTCVLPQFSNEPVPATATLNVLPESNNHS
jgi:hypothetical protein